MCLSQDGYKSFLFLGLFSRGTTLSSSLWDPPVSTALPGCCPTYSVLYSSPGPSKKSHTQESLSQALLLENLILGTGSHYPHFIDEEAVMQRGCPRSHGDRTGLDSSLYVPVLGSPLLTARWRGLFKGHWC